MDSELKIENKDVIINEYVENIEIDNSNVFIICKQDGKYNIKTKGKTNLVILVNDCDVKTNIQNIGELKVDVKTISKDNVKLNIDVENKNHVNVNVNSLNFSTTEVIGKLKVNHENTDSKLSLNSLEINSKKTRLIPILEVRKSNVKVSHSALSHKIMPKKLFYLTSKGISEKDAKRIIIKSYILNNTKIFHEDVEREIDKIIETIYKWILKLEIENKNVNRWLI